MEGLGTFTPTIDRTFAISFRIDNALNHGINLAGTFTGTILNRENIGKTSDELVAKWNADNPTDQVVFSAN